MYFEEFPKHSRAILLISAKGEGPKMGKTCGVRPALVVSTKIREFGEESRWNSGNFERRSKSVLLRLGYLFYHQTSSRKPGSVSSYELYYTRQNEIIVTIKFHYLMIRMIRGERPISKCISVSVSTIIIFFILLLTTYTCKN